VIVIDGSAGEGGGQILRSALTLSMVTGKPFRIANIHAGRPKPGLLRQHLACVRAAREISGATVNGEALGSTSLVFTPGVVQAGAYEFAVGTAGSIGLVLQTVLLPLALAGAPSRLTLRGGTHNPYAPPFEFLAESWLPQLRRIGFSVGMKLLRHGFYPAGGGCVEVAIDPAGERRKLLLEERGEQIGSTAEILAANLHPNVAAREAETLCTRLAWPEERVTVNTALASDGPGNAVLVRLTFENVTEIITSFGDPATSSEAVSSRAASQVRTHLAAGVPVGAHLADQLLLPMALAQGGHFITVPPTPHTLSNVEVIATFLGKAPMVERAAGAAWRISIPFTSHH
jgi:RNA 3'-terminal phosphate cyclase (ATP)